MTIESSNTEVRYTVKELLADIRGAVAGVDGKVAALDVKLDGKADKTDVVALSVRMDRLEKAEAARSAAAQQVKTDRDVQATRRRWAIGLAVGAGYPLASFLGSLFPHWMGWH